MPATALARLAASGETSCACTVHPAAARLRAMGKPIRPSPMKPTSPFGRNLMEGQDRSEEHTSELQSPCNLVCRLLLEKKNRVNPADGGKVCTKQTRFEMF